jgi:uncharacterized protein (UPF0128 family)
VRTAIAGFTNGDIFTVAMTTQNEQLTDRVRKALARIRNVKEKRMFGRVVFMVNGKMCMTSGSDRLMLRIDPKSHAAVDKAERRPTRHDGRIGIQRLRTRGRGRAQAKEEF